MRFTILIFIGGIWACNEVEPIMDPQKSIVIVEVYTAAMDPLFSHSSDTLLYSGHAYDGYTYEISAAGDTLSKIGYSQGLIRGDLRRWYSNGQLMEKRQYQNGQKNGLHLSYWENGNRRFEFTAIDDAYEGELREWDIEGNLTHLGNFSGGQEVGAQKLWYANGKIRANYVIKNGKRYGLLGTKNCINVSDSIFLSM